MNTNNLSLTPDRVSYTVREYPHGNGDNSVMAPPFRDWPAESEEPPVVTAGLTWSDLWAFVEDLGLTVDYPVIPPNEWVARVNGGIAHS
jgi:hypothetical protein